MGFHWTESVKENDCLTSLLAAGGWSFVLDSALCPDGLWSSVFGWYLTNYSTVLKPN